MKVHVPRLRLPEEVRDWMQASHVDECDVTFTERTEEQPPCTTMARRDGEGTVLRAWAELMRDGLHFYVTTSPMGSSGSLHLALRKKPVRECKVSVTAALAAALAERFHGPLQGLPRSSSVDWMKNAHRQIMSALRSNGASALDGAGQGFVELNRKCMKLVDRALRRDVDESLGRVRKEFYLLVDHVSEEDILSAFRETVVEKTHDQ